VLRDVTGDGRVNLLAFGDSITSGTGDDRSGDLRGYPARLSEILDLPVDSEGVPGEDLVGPGLARLTDDLATSNADIVILDEGNSDALDGISADQFRGALEQAVQRIQAAGKIPLLINQYPNCCDAGTGFDEQLNAVNAVIRDVGNANGVLVADVDRAWRSTCDQLPDCFLTHKPDGIHPNPQGYDVITEVVLAQMAGIDIFAPGGAAALETAFGLPAGSVIVKPDK
jgi:lysophospholipase L1-like esterase